MSSPIYNGPGDTIQHPSLAPPSAKAALHSNILPLKVVPQETLLAVPPGLNLPPIPGTPTTAFTNRSSANANLREGEADDNDNNAAGFTMGRRSREDADDETHYFYGGKLQRCGQR